MTKTFRGLVSISRLDISSVNEFMEFWLSRVFGFPRPDLENRWWHRMFNVVAVLSTVCVLSVTIEWAGQQSIPEYVYSFENDFGKYAGKIKKFDEIDKRFINPVFFVLKWRSSGARNEQYVAQLEALAKTDDDILTQIEGVGLLKNVTVKDLKNDFGGLSRLYLLASLATLGFYIFIVQGVYRVIAYIAAGRAE